MNEWRIINFEHHERSKASTKLSGIKTSLLECQINLIYGNLLKLV